MVYAVEMLRGHARHVMRCLGRGHNEKIYQNALIALLNNRGVAHRSEVVCPIWFMGQCVGMGRADLVIDSLVIEIKANKLPPSESSAQLQKYLQSLKRAEKKEFTGVVLNFNQKHGCIDMLEEVCCSSRDVGTRESELFKRSLAASSRSLLPEPDYVKRRKLMRLTGHCYAEDTP